MFDRELWSIQTEPTKIAFAGDWHENGWWGAQMIRYAREQGANTIVQVGDFGFRFGHNFLRHIRYAAHDENVTVYFVDGNHDNHNLIWKSWDMDEAGFMSPHLGKYAERVKYIPRGHRWQWWGLTFMGVGGAASVDKDWRTPGADWWDTEMISWGDIRRATRGGPVDVMVAHDIFESAPFPNHRKDHGWPEDALRAAQQNRLALQTIVDEVQPRLYVHGHYHVRKDAMAKVNDRWVKIVGLSMDGTNTERNMWIVSKEDLVSG